MENVFSLYIIQFGLFLFLFQGLSLGSQTWQTSILPLNCTTSPLPPFLLVCILSEIGLTKLLSQALNLESSYFTLLNSQDCKLPTLQAQPYDLTFIKEEPNPVEKCFGLFARTHAHGSLYGERKRYSPGESWVVSYKRGKKNVVVVVVV